jgi:hypothetical protein
MLTFETVETEFLKLYPFGSITKYSNTEYGVYFTSDTRTATEKEVETNWHTVTDTRKLYTYRVSNLKQMANKLKLNIVEKSKVNLEWELQRIKDIEENIDYSLELFGE